MRANNALQAMMCLRGLLRSSRAWPIRVSGAGRCGELPLMTMCLKKGISFPGIVRRLLPSTWGETRKCNPTSPRPRTSLFWFRRFSDNSNQSGVDGNVRTSVNLTALSSGTPLLGHPGKFLTPSQGLGFWNDSDGRRARRSAAEVSGVARRRQRGCASEALTAGPRCRELDLRPQAPGWATGRGSLRARRVGSCAWVAMGHCYRGV